MAGSNGTLCKSTRAKTRDAFYSLGLIHRFPFHHSFRLDSIGGPNHLNNLCDTGILAVPHRAVNGSHTPPTFDFEHTNASARFGTNVGDSRTREELNALGFPAKHLDDGLAVQPMYYYMGHISRYVRPGSRAVHGIVNSAKSGFRTFRSPGQVVAGGGMNDLARVELHFNGAVEAQKAMVAREIRGRVVERVGQ